MKLIVLGAGAGTRIQLGGFFTPKIIFQFQNEPLAEWSLKPWKSLFRNKTFSQSDLVFVLRAQDDSHLKISTDLKKRFGDGINIIRLDIETQGPSQSAFLALKELLNGGILKEDERVIFTDCDHYFDDPNLPELIEQLERDDQSILVVERPNPELETNSCFVIRENNSVKGFIEKPYPGQLELESITHSLVGIYSFPTALRFFELSEQQRVQLDFDSNFAISSLYNLHIKLYPEKIIQHVISEFTNLGDSNALAKAHSKILSSKFIYERETIFIDFDGSLVKHESGTGSASGEYKNSPEWISSIIPEKLQKLNRAGIKIVITSARPEEERIKLNDFFEEQSIKIHALILGITNGPRILINDSKPAFSSVETAMHINLIRGNDAIVEILEEISTSPKIYLRRDISGESKAEVLHLSSAKGNWVRKSGVGINDLLEYQTLWYQMVMEFKPQNVPRVLRKSIQDFGVSFFDTEYISKLQPLSSLQMAANRNLEEDLVATIDCLEEIYSFFELNRDVVMADFVSSLYNEKIIKPYEAALSVLGEVNNLEFLTWSFESEKIPNCVLLLKKTLNEILCSKQIDWAQRNYSVTLVHGDPTLGNICKSEENVMLMDPVGSRIDPTFDGIGLGRTFSHFDFERLRLSIEDRYDHWNQELITDGTNLSYIKAKHDNNKEDSSWDNLANILKRSFPKNRKFDSPLLSEIIQLSTYCRILPYKCTTKIKEAYYLFFLISKSLVRIQNVLKSDRYGEY